MTASGPSAFLSRVTRGYREIGSRVGFLAMLVLLSAALGALVSLPLWLFSTSRPAAYTAAVLAAAAAAIVTAIVRRVVRSGIGWPRVGAKALAVLLGIVKAVLFLAGLYATAAFAARGRLLPAALGGLAFLVAAAWIGWGMRAGTPPSRHESDR